MAPIHFLVQFTSSLSAENKYVNLDTGVLWLCVPLLLSLLSLAPVILLQPSSLSSSN